MIEQGEFFQIDNPCINVCEVNNKGYCKGCFRSRIERQIWYTISEYQRYLITQTCRARKLRVMAYKEAQNISQVQKEISFNVQDELF
jgi:predicted Fe-S protein YdhL (DUF1289 family)